MQQANRLRIGRAEPGGQRGQQPTALGPADIHHLRAILKQLVDACPRHAHRFGLLFHTRRIVVQAKPHGGELGDLLAEVDFHLRHDRFDNSSVHLFNGRQLRLVDRFQEPTGQRRHESRHENDVEVLL